MEKGLTSLEVQEKQKIFGKNEIKAEERISTAILFLSQFPTFINGILVMASILSFVIGNTLDGTLILIILFLNALFGFAQEYRAEKSLDKLKAYVKSEVRVIRDGKVIQVDAADLVPGDIVRISEGDKIPADGKIISDKFLEIDESILTGESLSVIKRHNDPVFSGTLVTKGNSRILIATIGNQTRFGQIAQTLGSVAPDKTPLQKRLDGLAKILSIVIVVIAAIIVPTGILQGKEFIPLLLIAVSISIAAIPEGLPAVVTIALAIGTSKMAKRKAIVRRMQSVETLGAVQIIITDKTGTLTQNTMRVKKFWTPKKEYEDSLIRACTLGNTASLIEKKEKNSFDVIGDKTDGALLFWAKEKAGNLEEIKSEGKILEEYSFDPQTSTVTTIWQKKSATGEKHIFVRGAPEVILSKSRLSEKEKEEINKIYEEYAREGYRVIGFATRTADHHSLPIAREDAEKNLTFLGIVGIYDPPRLEAKKAVEEARKAGIQTIMVTGDNVLTASALAREIGLLETGDDIATGEEIDKLSDEELEKIILKTRIFARTKPEDKLRLVTVLKKMGYVVGVTGDGVNDALALKRADVGLAMGECGTDVAKEASDIILTDDNFSTVVSAVEEGRTIYNNIIKAITYLLATNFSDLAFVFFANLIGLPNPFFPTQILWINLVTDGLPALALASDNKDHSVLNNKPRSPNAPILNRIRLTSIIAIGLSLSFCYLLIFSTLLENGSSETFARTIVLNALVVSHMALAFLMRGKTIFKFNKFLILGVTFTLILQAVITFNPFFQKIFRLGF
ncbi:MAG: calcium-translocating P-type ATPase, PMCA-type [Candidatus Levybacteria bacterium RIFCSPHIGHO2_02_FULL_37_10]|nr:MAG: calcium-translocating P-type ATPase, PMCA-type [Candidatus Levybacteria bacterium RIFCSPHIGHO2_02_FULL_37_10]